MFEWTKENEALLGTQSDHDIAEILGVSRQRISSRRAYLGIPAYHPWTKESDALLGTDTDEKIAARLDKPVSQVRRRRQDLRIPSFVGLRPLYQLTPQPPKKFKWQEEIEFILANNNNTAASRILGWTVTKVSRCRIELGIERKPSQHEIDIQNRNKEIFDKFNRGMTKAAIARELGLTSTTIRKVLGKHPATPNDSKSQFPPKLLATLKANGFRNKQEISRVFDYDPRYFLTLPGIGMKAVAEIAKAINRENPLPLDKKVLDFTVTRLKAGKHFDLQSPEVPIHSTIANRYWIFFEITRGQAVRVLLDKEGYRLID